MASAVYTVTRKWRITYVQDHDPGSDPGKRKCPHGEKPCVHNPDLDPAFYDYYKETCELISDYWGRRIPLIFLTEKVFLVWRLPAHP